MSIEETENQEMETDNGPQEDKEFQMKILGQIDFQYTDLYSFGDILILVGRNQI